MGAIDWLRKTTLTPETIDPDCCCKPVTSCCWCRGEDGVHPDRQSLPGILYATWTYVGGMHIGDPQVPNPINLPVSLPLYLVGSDLPPYGGSSPGDPWHFWQSNCYSNSRGDCWTRVTFGCRETFCNYKMWNLSGGEGAASGACEVIAGNIVFDHGAPTPGECVANDIIDSICHIDDNWWFIGELAGSLAVVVTFP